MINRVLITRLALPLVLLLLAVGVAQAISFRSGLPSATAPRRSDDVYVDKIVAAFPAAKDAFSIGNVTVEKNHWVIVDMKNAKNNDTLHVLFYDPLYGPSGMRVIAGPSTATSFDTLMDDAHIPPEGEVQDASK